MITRVSRCLAALMISFVAMPVFAASVYLELNPASAPVVQGDPFEVRLYVDAADQVVNTTEGEVPASVSGSVRIEFNSTLATYSGFAIDAGVSPATCSPVLCLGNITTPGADNRISAAFSQAIFADSSAPPVLIGTFSFNSVAGTGGGPFGINVVDAYTDADGTPFLTSFANIEPTNKPFTPGFNGTTVAIAATAVPVPAAAWLMMSALGVLGLRARSRGA